MIYWFPEHCGIEIDCIVRKRVRNNTVNNEFEQGMENVSEIDRNIAVCNNYYSYCSD